MRTAYKKLFKELEWAGSRFEDVACPSCGALKEIDLPATPDGKFPFEPKGIHKAGCKLKLALDGQLGP